MKRAGIPVHNKDKGLHKSIWRSFGQGDVDDAQCRRKIDSEEEDLERHGREISDVAVRIIVCTLKPV